MGGAMMTKSIHHQNILECFEHYFNPAHFLIRFMIKRKRAKDSGKKFTYLSLQFGINFYNALYQRRRMAVTVIAYVLIMII